MALTLFPFFDSVCRDASCGTPCLGHSVRSQQRECFTPGRSCCEYIAAISAFSTT